MRGGGEELAKRVDGHLARDFARRVTAHAIGNDVQARVLEDGEVILVVRALHADVGFAGDLDSQSHCACPFPNLHATTRRVQIRGL